MATKLTFTQDPKNQYYFFVNLPDGTHVHWHFTGTILEGSNGYQVFLNSELNVVDVLEGEIEFESEGEAKWYSRSHVFNFIAIKNGMVLIKSVVTKNLWSTYLYRVRNGHARLEESGQYNQEDRGLYTTKTIYTFRPNIEV